MTHNGPMPAQVDGTGLVDPAPRDLWVNAAVLAFFGGLWCGWAQSASPAGWVGPLVVAEVLGVVIAIGCVVVLRRNRPASSRMSSPQAQRRYRIVVGAEVALCVAGAIGLGASGHPRYIASWILLVVGVHLWPLSTLMEMPALALTSVAVTVVALLAVLLGAIGTAEPAFAAGGFGSSLRT